MLACIINILNILKNINKFFFNIYIIYAYIKYLIFFFYITILKS